MTSSGEHHKKRFELFCTLEQDAAPHGILRLRSAGGGWRWLGWALIAYGAIGTARTLTGLGHHGFMVVLAPILGLAMSLPWKLITIDRALGRLTVRQGLYLPLKGEFAVIEQAYSLADLGQVEGGCELERRPDESGATGIPTRSWVAQFTGQDPSKKLVLANFSFRRTAEALAAALNEAL